LDHHVANRNPTATTATAVADLPAPPRIRDAPQITRNSPSAASISGASVALKNRK
jgi:hypothetical protein